MDDTVHKSIDFEDFVEVQAIKEKEFADLIKKAKVRSKSVFTNPNSGCPWIFPFYLKTTQREY